ncbi:MAG: TlpA family protein disulfide reductase, partial [Gemmatimonadetes bacterium]|nr:TlpA family protein disulfide reductase [Gemmatimonadota bacterium]
VVAFWSRFCAPALWQLEPLERLHRAFAGRGIRLLTITAEPPSFEMRKFLVERGLTFPVFHDTRGEAARAFGQWSTPEYYVLDASGRVRFQLSSLEEIPRQVAALQVQPVLARSGSRPARPAATSGR